MVNLLANNHKPAQYLYFSDIVRVFYCLFNALNR